MAMGFASSLTNHQPILGNLLLLTRSIFRIATGVFTGKVHRVFGIPRYEASKPLTMGGELPFYDARIATYSRAILEYGYETVVEIGAHDGKAILKLKQLLPHINAIGLDILPQFEPAFELDGVSFQKFDLKFFEQKRPKAVVVCNGTLVCFKAEELKQFFRACHAGGYDIVFREPATLAPLQESLPRSQGTYYHAYDRYLRDAGYTVQGDYQAAVKCNVCLSLMETLYCNIARCKAA